MLEHLLITRSIVNRNIATIYLSIFCFYLIWLPSLMNFSAEKFVLMALAPLIFIIRTPYLSKALLWGGLYWLICYFCASFQDYIRFSTLGFLGMYILTYIVYYNLVYSDAFSLLFFMNLIKGLIIAFGVVLILQQMAMLIGINTFWPINLYNQPFLSITKLPSLTTGAQPFGTNSYSCDVSLYEVY